MNPFYTQQRQMELSAAPKQVIVAEPFLYTTLQALIGKLIVVETSRGNISGVIRDVKMDHLVIQEAESTFFIRMCKVIWIMPE